MVGKTVALEPAAKSSRVPLFIWIREKPSVWRVEPSKTEALPETFALSNVTPLCEDAIPMTGALAEATAAPARIAHPTVDSMWSFNIPP